MIEAKFSWVTETYSCYSIFKVEFLHKNLHTQLFAGIAKQEGIHIQIMLFSCCLKMGFSWVGCGTWLYRLLIFAPFLL